MSRHQQHGLFDNAPAHSLPAARAARDDGMARAAAGAPAEWKDTARLAIRHLCLNRETWICDDVWEVLHVWSISPPSNKRALGPLVTEAVKAGMCEDSGIYRPSSQVQCHANPRKVWRSTMEPAE